MSHDFIIGIVVFLLVLSIIFQIIIGVIYQNMINETDNMTATDNQLLKQCKTRFVNCYRMNGGVANIPIFVEKFINHLKIGNISLIALQHWSGQLVLFSVFVSGMGIYIGITRGDGFFSLMPYYIISLIGLYVYFGVSSAMDIAGKKRLLKTNLVDYMENHMVKRLELLPESMRMANMTEEDLGLRKRRIAVEPEEYEEDMDESVTEKRAAKKPVKPASKTKQHSYDKEEAQDNEELEMLLRELLS